MSARNGERDPLGWVKEHPVASLLGAVAVGYALGGGIPTRTTRRLVSAAFKFGLLPLLQREAEVLLEAAARPPR